MMPKEKTRLYVWEGFCPDYRGGLAFAIAASEEEARQLVLKDLGLTDFEWGELTVYSTKKKIAKAVCGGA